MPALGNRLGTSSDFVWGTGLHPGGMMCMASGRLVLSTWPSHGQPGHHGVSLPVTWSAWPSRGQPGQQKPFRLSPGHTEPDMPVSVWPGDVLWEAQGAVCLELKLDMSVCSCAPVPPILVQCWQGQLRSPPSWGFCPRANREAFQHWRVGGTASGCWHLWVGGRSWAHLAGGTARSLQSTPCVPRG